MNIFPPEVVLVNVENNVLTTCRQQYHVGTIEKRMYKLKEWRVMMSQVTSITLWGGKVLDCGEYELSSLLLDTDHNLRHLTYNPSVGVPMVRPLYCKNERAGRHLFPALESICMPDVGSPLDWGFITPNLKRIEIIIKVPDQDIKPWISLEKARLLFEENPKLDEISIVVGKAEDELMGRQTVLTIYTPHKRLWEKKKMVLLSMLKEKPSECSLARIPNDILRKILPMCGSCWEIYDENGLRIM